MANQSLRDIMGSKSALNQGLRNSFDTLVDIVYVIDGTGSMQNCLDAVKQNAIQLHEKIIAGLKDKNRNVKKMRIKVIVFRDIYVDADAFEESRFFDLPEEADSFRTFVENIRAQGGGDEPESGLEALYKAIHVDWQNNNGGKARQIVVLMTDASAHKLDDPQRSSDPKYPLDIPADVDNLVNLQGEWSKMDPKLQRLVLMAPNVWPWTSIAMWSNTQYAASEAGTGISDAQYADEIIPMISGSV